MARLFVVGLLLVTACRRDPAMEWRDAQRAWSERAPGAWSMWRALPEAHERLVEAARRYEEGVVLFEHNDPRATDVLREGAQLGPIDPDLYLRLARASRSRGAEERAESFYRRYLAESPDGSARVEAERALSAHVDDPFSPVPERSSAIPIALSCGVLIALAIWLRPRPVRLTRLLAEHPERASSFTYLAGILRHELLKHRLAPARAGALVESVELEWRRHVDAIGAALGLPRDWVKREPTFRAAARAIMDLRHPRSLGALNALDRALVAWTRTAKSTPLVASLFDRLIASLRDERAGRSLGVSISIACADDLGAVVFEDDLLLVLRNVVRNAIAQGDVRIETRVHLDPTGGDWARIVVSDRSPLRPGIGAPDRGLGIVRQTLERYGGALVEESPAPGFEKALAVSLPRVDPDDEPATIARAA